MIRVLALGGVVLMAQLGNAEILGLRCAQTAPDAYRLEFSLDGSTHSARIFAGTQPGRGNSHPLVTATSSPVIVHAGHAGERVYFRLEPDHGKSRAVSIRRLPLEGAANFRDLGGYETADGRFVKWGLLYRSDQMSRLTSNDLQYVRHLGIRLVCDFRTDSERAFAPDRLWEGKDLAFEAYPIESASVNPHGAFPSLLEQLGSGASPEVLEKTMENGYRLLPFRAAEAYRATFHRLLSGDFPALVHCTAGKDRTGLFSALLLMTLGVPKKTAAEDYALTNDFLTDPAKRREMVSHVQSALPGRRISEEQMDTIFAADPRYLEGALSAIREKYGSLDEYRRRELGLSDPDVERLRSLLLEP